MFAAVLAGSALAGSTATIAKPRPVATLQAENAAFNQRNWQALYSAYTARYKAKCPYGKFAREYAAIRKQFPAGVTTRVKSTRVVGSKAYLVYSIISGGTVVGTTPNGHPDVFTRINGLWFDEYEGSSVCDN